MHIFHKYDKWKLIESRMVLRRIDQPPIGIVTTQERKCKVCGYIQVTKQRILY